MNMIRHNNISPDSPGIRHLPCTTKPVMHRWDGENGMTILSTNRDENDHGTIQRRYDRRMRRMFPQGLGYFPAFWGRRGSRPSIRIIRKQRLQCLIRRVFSSTGYAIHQIRLILLLMLYTDQDWKWQVYYWTL